jgi:predicted nucleic acid-binding protein
VAEVAYLDSSAIVKTIVREPESPGLRRFLRRFPRHASSGLARAEILRAIRRAQPDAIPRAQDALRRLVLLELTDEMLTVAGMLEPPTLRTLEAIHLASALRLGAQLEVLITYEQRMVSAAAALGLPVEAPS